MSHTHERIRMNASPSADIRVRLQAVCRGFQEGGERHAVLSDLSATFLGGEAVALRGRSGSGKSTLLNLICGIDVPDSGTVQVAGRDLTAMPERARTLHRRAHIGFVYQAFNLVATLTVADNVKLVLELNGVGDAAAASRVAELLDAVGLYERRDSYPDILSGGEQQRVAIARALAHRPDILLADEPTGNLDDRTAATVLELLANLRREQGATLIVATHSAAVAASCDRVLELAGGRLVAPG
jgi:putative ABC transport system ATP-binding protein